MGRHEMQSNSTIGERVCHRCGHDIGRVERVGRRDTCLHCGTDLHCCLNCAFYGPAYHNQCQEPQAERQVDKQVGNFCDYFSFRIGRKSAADTAQKESARARLDALFGKSK
jgi:hypothetical protein